jgi:hypothetical protein
MDHVDVDDRIRVLDRPFVRRGRVEPQRRQQVRQSDLGPPGFDAGKRLGRGVRWLPLQAGQGGGVVDGVLARTGGNFQHQAVAGQAGFQHRKDRVAVAGGGGRGHGAGWHVVRHDVSP